MGIMNSGVKQWLFQRVTNALIVTFGLVLLSVFFTKNGLTYDSLTSLISNSAFTLYFAVVLILSCFNSVLAAWQIDGDYAKKFSIPSMLITITAALVSLLYLIYGLKIIF